MRVLQEWCVRVGASEGVGLMAGARDLLSSSGQLVGGASELDLLLNDNYMN